MPLTFPAHAAAVLPFKLARPHWFDGVALVIGSAAPDFAYALDGSWLERPVSGGPAMWQVAHSWLGVLVWGLPVTLLGVWLVRAAGPIIASHPAWPITVGSAVLGAASHVLWDRLADHGWIDVASSVAGTVIATVLLVHLGSRHRPPPHLWTRRFWVAAILVIGAGAVALPFLPGASLVHTTGVRVLLLLGLAPLVGSIVARH